VGFDFQDILYEKKDHIARIIINRPQARNALSPNVFKELAEAFHDVGYDPAIGVVVLTGAGDEAFAAGADVKNFNKRTTRDSLEGLMIADHFNTMASAMRNCGKPIIARIFGDVIGGGFELLLFCDLAIAADNTRLIGGEAFIGAVPIGATQLLTVTIGDKRARWMLLTDDRIDAQTAYEWGLVNKVVPFKKLDEEVDKLCQTLLHKFPWALRFTKTQLNFWHDITSTILYQGRDFWAVHVACTAEMLEGTSAFLEKRPTAWMEMRAKAALGKPAEYIWGAPLKNCSRCGAKNLPDDFKFCGKCGTKLGT